MSQDNDNIRDEVKKIFEGFEYKVTDDVWDGIEKDVKKKNRRFVGFYYAAGAAALFLGGLISGFFMSELLRKDGFVATQNTTVVQSTSAIQIYTNTYENTHNQNGNNINNEIKNDAQNNEHKIIRNNRNNLLYTKSGENLSQTSGFIENSSEIYSGTYENDIKPTTEITHVIAQSFVSSDSTLIDTVILQNEVANIQTLKNNVEKDEKPQKRKNSIALTIGFNNYRNINYESPQSLTNPYAGFDATVPVENSSRNLKTVSLGDFQRLKYSIPLSFGINYRYAIGNRLGLNFDAGYSIWRSCYTKNNVYHLAKMHYFMAGSGVSCNLMQKRKILLSTSLGFDVSRMMYGNYITENAYYQSNKIKTSGFYSSVFVGSEVGYKMNQKTFLILSSQVRYYTGNDNQVHYIRGVQNYYPELKIGVRKNL